MHIWGVTKISGLEPETRVRNSNHCATVSLTQWRDVSETFFQFESSEIWSFVMVEKGMMRMRTGTLMMTMIEAQLCSCQSEITGLSEIKLLHVNSLSLSLVVLSVMVWCDVVLCYVVCHGVVWCCLVLCCVSWCGVMWCCLVLCVMVWCYIAPSYKDSTILN